MDNKKFNIGFFGHSNCAGSQPDSYLRILAEHFNATIVNKGVGQCSEERILFEIKKCKNLDMAVICHSRASSLYLPRCTRDIDIGANEIKAYRGTYGNIPAIFQTEKEFIACITYYRHYLYDTNLHLSRFQGALLLVDSYCASKIPVVIHILDESHKPNWFTTFSSGIRSKEAESVIKNNRGTHSNGMTIEGNKKIAEILIELIIQQLADCGRVDHTPT
jgi:hypothetical protein